ncbi:MAG: 2-amino-4-hydroxy-6-hydroxymethyldihydropteridine diphosphokinase [Synechococcus sp.]
MSASLADQPRCLAVALGANWPGPAGDPHQTLLTVRPRLEQLVVDWAGHATGCRWSPLVQTSPVGGPGDQPRYWNAVVVVDGLRQQPQLESALVLLDALQQLEAEFGRDRALEQRWGPRPLDLDLLFWDVLRIDHPRLVLPHPRLHLRTFVLEPLLAALQGSVDWSL